MEIVAQPQTEAKQSRFKMRRPSMPNMRGAGTFVRRRKKMLILSGMFVLLIVTGYLNWTLNSSTPEVGGGGSGGGGGGNAGTQQHMFYSFRSERDNLRTANKLGYEFMATSENFNADARAHAAQRLNDLRAASDFERAAEVAIRTMGFQDGFVEKRGQNVNVIVRNPESINQEQSTRILTGLSHIAERDLLDYLHVSTVQ